MKAFEIVSEETKTISNNKFDVTDSRPTALFKTDGTIIQLSDSCQEVFGLSELNNIIDILDERSIVNWRKFSLNLTNTKDISFIMRYELPSYGISSIRIRIYYYDDTRDMIAVFTVPEKQIENKSDYYSKLVRKTDNFMALIDNDGIIIDVNDRSYEFFNLPRNFFLGKEAKIFGGVFPQSADRYIGFLETIYEEGFAESIDRFELSTGDVRYYRTMTFYDHVAGMYLTYISDETELVELREGLANDRPTITVRKITANVVNEIKNPLTMLKGFTQLLSAVATKETKEYVGVIEVEVDRIESILNKLLNATNADEE